MQKETTGFIKMDEITGIVLAGGKSSRMGSEKGLVEINNKKMIEYILEQLQEVTKKIIIISNTNKYDYLGYPVYADIIKDVGPLGGIYTGLYYSQTNYNLIVSCDTPFVKKEVFIELIKNIGEHEIIISSENNNKHPLCAIYSRGIMNILKQSIEKKELKLKKILDDFKTIFVSFQSGTLFTNINTKEDAIKASVLIK